MAPEI